MKLRMYAAVQKSKNDKSSKHLKHYVIFNYIHITHINYIRTPKAHCFITQSYVFRTIIIKHANYNKYGWYKFMTILII